MKLIVGLGNPGMKYAKNRHNVGRMALDGLSKELSWTGFLEQKKFEAEMASGMVGKRQVLIAKPQTYMNRSGSSVQKIVDFYNLDMEHDVLVIQDDIDLEFGKLKLKFAGSHGGHNGVRDIMTKSATDRFWRVKLGVGRPINPHIDVADYVLGDFDGEQEHFWSYQTKHIHEKVLERCRNTGRKRR